MSEGKQVFKVTASPRQRFRLARMLLHPKVTFKTLEHDRRLRRARLALGLMGVTEVMMEHGRVSDDYANDRRRNVFSVTAENVELLKTARAQSELTSFDSLILIELFDQLEAATDAADAEEADDFDDAQDLPRWKPSKLPAFKGPEQFYDVLRQALTDARSSPEPFARFSEVLLAAIDPPAPAADAPSSETNGHADVTV